MMRRCSLIAAAVSASILDSWLSASPMISNWHSMAERRSGMSNDVATEDPVVESGKADLQDWTPAQGEAITRAEGISMTPAHWEVVNFLRDHYMQHGKPSARREWAELLGETFAAQGGTAYLLKQFPRGSVAQASRIGGLPVPPYTEDPSFGSTM